MKIEVNNINFWAGCLQIPIPPRELEKAQELQKKCSEGKRLSVEIKPVRKQRSLSANAYCWVLCDLIAQKIRSTKDEVYKSAIRNVGVFDVVLMKFDAVSSYIEHWQRNGVGWVADDLGPAKNAPGCSEVASYYGSSTYNSAEMKVLLDFLYDEADKLGCDVMSEADKDLISKEWGNKHAT